MSIGRDEDNKAFGDLVWYECWTQQFGNHTILITMDQIVKMNPEVAMRFAFEAGMKRGEEKRGCCHEHDPETVAIAVAREAEERDG